MVYEMLDESSHLFEVTVTSDSPAQAGCEPQMAHRSGFLAAYFIKPPVSLKLSFTCPGIVQVQKISFCPRIGKQCSTAATVSVRTHSQRDRLVQVWRGNWDSRITEVMLDGSANFRPNRIFSSSTSPGVTEAREKNEPSSNSSLTRFVLPRNAALGEVTEIVLTITRTDVSTAVALTDLRIYGQPSHKIGKDALQSFLQRISTLVAHENDKKRPVVEKDSSTSSKRLCLREPLPTETLLEESARELPEAFLDELTYEVMSDPVILPSGRTVDMSSIKTHELVQRELGRRLFDPFTGVHCNYADIRSDTRLQQRIMEFLKDNETP